MRCRRRLLRQYLATCCLVVGLCRTLCFVPSREAALNGARRFTFGAVGRSDATQLQADTFGRGVERILRELGLSRMSRWAAQRSLKKKSLR
eukprot:5194724-Amphidinium_carterae.1